MKVWPVQEAKARFSALLVACERHGPQMVTKRGAEAAVVVPAAEWRRLSTGAQRSLKELLLAPEPRSDDFVIPARRAAKRRAPPEF